MIMIGTYFNFLGNNDIYVKIIFYLQINTINTTE